MLSYDSPRFLPGGIFWFWHKEEEPPGYCNLTELGIQRSEFRKSEATGTCRHKTKGGAPPIKSPGNLLGVPLSLKLTVKLYTRRPRLHDSSCEQPPGTCKLTTTRDLTSGRFSHSDQLKWKGLVNNQGIQQRPQNGHSCFCSMTGDFPQQSLKISLEWIKLTYKMNSLKTF